MGEGVSDRVRQGTGGGVVEVVSVGLILINYKRSGRTRFE